MHRCAGHDRERSRRRSGHSGCPAWAAHDTEGAGHGQSGFHGFPFAFPAGPLYVAVTGFRIRHRSRGRVGQRMRSLQPHPGEFISSRGCPNPASWARTRDAVCRCRPSGFYRVSKTAEMQTYPQLTCRPTAAYLYTPAPICSPLEPGEAMGIIFPKSGYCGAIDH